MLSTGFTTGSIEREHDNSLKRFGDDAMIGSRIRAAAMVAAASAALAGCSTYGGYGGLSLGYGGGYYDDYYYPGTGYYVYDRRGTRHRWNDSQRRYWQSRERREDRREVRQNRREFRADRRDDRARFSRFLR